MDLPEKVYRAFVRRLQPRSRHAVWNGVKVTEDISDYRRWGDDYLPDSFLGRVDYPDSEGGEIKFHEQFIESGDTVVIIGGGRGVTAVSAANKTGEEGEVIVYEASEKYASLIQDVIDLNNVSSICDVRRAVVSDAINVFGSDGSAGADVVYPTDIPDCDVIEMDCEGAEFDIIREMKIRPRAAIVEVHPGVYPEMPDVVRSKMSDIGYRDVGLATNEGRELNEAEFESALQDNADGVGYAPVVGFRR